MYFDNPDQFINWRAMFQHCTEVTTIEVQEGGMNGLLQALTPPKHADPLPRGNQRERKWGEHGRGAQAQAPIDDDNHGPAPVYVPIFPKLTALLLTSLAFYHVMPGSDTLFNLLLKAIKRRKANKTPLTMLCIDDCFIREKQANVLEKVVCDFRWDHKENHEFSEDSDCEDHHSYHSSEFDDCGDEYSTISDLGVWEESAHVSSAQAE